MADRVLYADDADFARLGLRAGALAGVPTDDLLAHLRAASDQADMWLASIGGYATPLAAWGDDLRRYVCELAALSALQGLVGFNPEGTDRTYVDRAANAAEQLIILAALGSPTLVSGP